jgi:hypothetical protein
MKCWCEISGSHGGQYEVWVFWDVALCSHVEVDRRFRGVYCHHQGDESSSLSQSPWWWRQYTPLKRRSTSTWQHGATSQWTWCISIQEWDIIACLKVLYLLECGWDSNVDTSEMQFEHTAEIIVKPATKTTINFVKVLLHVSGFLEFYYTINMEIW